MGQNAMRNLMGNRDAIRKLMAMDASGEMDRIVEERVNDGSLVGSSEGYTYQAMQKQQPTQGETCQAKVNITEDVIKGHPNMPRQILESFAKNPGKEATFGMSVLDGYVDTSVKQKPVMESKRAVQQHPAQQQSGPVIDYSLIKTIINEAVQENVKKYMSAFAKKLISEGVGSGGNNEVKAIKIGDKFSLVMTNGDIYESQLKFKRNINQVND